MVKQLTQRNKGHVYSPESADILAGLPKESRSDRD